MSGNLSCSALILLFCIIYVPATMEQVLPPKALNPERLQLMQDALSSMTFRKDGQLASFQDLQPFLNTLKGRYQTSKYYKTLLTAFQHGVLPRLTLNENDACDPAVMLEYRDPFNNSVTDASLKKFIFGSYDKQSESSRQVCNYQKGLMCNNQTKRCECPQGSKMGPISERDAVKRCLLDENEVCSLIDLGHDPSSKYGALKKHLPVMILNLERPLSCKIGTQCRFKSTSENTPHCYSVNGGPWDKGKWSIDLGEECALGLYADTGQCKQKDFSLLGGYTCFNFGPESLPKSLHAGICAHELGSYGISNSFTESQGLENWDPMFIGFVSPATTPLRGAALKGYYMEYLSKLHLAFQSVGSLSTVSTEQGQSCSVSKTKTFLESWKFFLSLEETPPAHQGKGYVATEAELQDRLKQVVDLTVDLKKKVCRVYTMYHSYSKSIGLKCIPEASTDADGNDGKCQAISENEDGTASWAKTFFDMRKKVSEIHDKQENEEKNYRKDLLEPVETNCDPTLGPPPGSEGAAPSTDNDVLEGGYCPPDRVCYEDYRDEIVMNDEFCNPNTFKVYRTCQSLDDNRQFGRCEAKALNRKIMEEKLELSKLTSYSRLDMGDTCQYDLEQKIRNWIVKDEMDIMGKKYKVLIELDELKNGGNNGLCDRTKLLHCSQEGTCECFPNTQPRRVIMGEGQSQTYSHSEYCYVTSGNCHPRSLSNLFYQTSEMEKNEINNHYNKEDEEEDEYSEFDPNNCQGSNWCVFTRDDSYLQNEEPRFVCSTRNTGTTGYGPEENVKPVTKPGEPSKPETITTDKTDKVDCEGDECDYEEAGGTKKEVNGIFKIVMIILVINVIG